MCRVYRRGDIALVRTDKERFIWVTKNVLKQYTKKAIHLVQD